MRFAGPIHESEEERKNIIQAKFTQDKGVYPVFGVSCEDGILLVGINSRPEVTKVRSLLERVAITGTGNLSDFNRTYQKVSSHAKVQAYVYLSSGDMRIIEDVRSIISREFRYNFRQLHSSDYSECEIILATLGFNQNEDELYSIDFTGYAKKSKRIVRIPNIHYFDDQEPDQTNINIIEDREIKKGLAMTNTMPEALKVISRVVKEARINQPVFMEVKILSREEARSKNFEKVYRKLTTEEIQNWTS